MSLLEKLRIKRKPRFPIGIHVTCKIILQTTETHWKVLFRIPEHEDFIWFIPANKAPYWIRPMIEEAIGLDLTGDWNIIDGEESTDVKNCVHVREMIMREIYSLYKESKTTGKMDRVVRIDWSHPKNWEIRIEENNRMKKVA